MVCLWYKNVEQDECISSIDYYSINQKLNKKVSPYADMMKQVKYMIEYPININNLLDQQHQQQQPYHPQQQQQHQIPVVNRNQLIENQQGIKPLNRSTINNNPYVTVPKYEPTNNKVIGDHTPIYPEQHSNIYDTGKIYVSNLGELSTDIGSSFDPKTSKIIKVSDDSLATHSTNVKESELSIPIPTKHSAVTILPSIQPTSTVAPTIVNSGYGDSLTHSFLRKQPAVQSLNINFNIVNSGEGDALTHQLYGVLQTTSTLQPNLLNFNGGIPTSTTPYPTTIDTLNSNYNRNIDTGNLIPTVSTTISPINSGEGDSLTHSIFGKFGYNPYNLNRDIINSGEGDALSHSIYGQIPNVIENKKIFSGEGDALTHDFYSKLQKQQQVFGQIISSGEGDALSHSLYGKLPQPIYSGEGDTLTHDLYGKIKNQQETGEGDSLSHNLYGKLSGPVYSGEGDALTHDLYGKIPKLTHSGEGDALSHTLNHKLQTPIYSGEGDALTHDLFGKLKGPIYSGEGDALTHDLYAKQPKLINSGEGDALAHDLIHKRPKLTYSGEGDALTHDLIRKRPSLTYSGEGDSLTHDLYGKLSAPQYSGEGDSLTHSIYGQNPKLTESGEGDSLTHSIFGQNRRPVYSGEGDALTHTLFGKENRQYLPPHENPPDRHYLPVKQTPLSPTRGTSQKPEINVVVTMPTPSIGEYSTTSSVPGYNSNNLPATYGLSLTQTFDQSSTYRTTTVPNINADGNSTPSTTIRPSVSMK